MKNVILVLFLAICSMAYSKENLKNHPKKKQARSALADNCAGPSSQAVLDINNVKTTLLNGGDMWWNLSDGRYEVPKNSGIHSLFNGGIWIGGLDDEGQLKVAAQTYRQSGNDFWPGPLDNVRLSADGSLNNQYGTTNTAVCAQYNFHHVITRAEVQEFIAYSSAENPSIEFPNYSIPVSILEYPGNRTTDNQNGDANESADNQVETNAFYALETLAPFRDVDGNGSYNPQAGDYPEYNLDGALNCQEADVLYGDQTIWWVINDNGGAHSTSGSIEPIGLEIQTQAFAFAPTSIEAIDNATFYNYKLINRSHNALNNAYFGVSVDPDLGDYQDDYVGCDVARGLGYCYNGDEEDGTAAGYGLNPPAIGVDFLRGPEADEADGIDNDKDGEVDEPGEQIIMSKFVYFNNDGSVTGNPYATQDYYNYLQGKWLDNNPMTYGTDGRNSSSPECNYMFPGTSDPDFEEAWTEQIAGNAPADRRFLQSVGSFTLEPGAIKTITKGVVWSRASSGGAMASLEKLKLDDDYVQEIFDSCFDIPCQEPNASLATFSLVEEDYGLNMNYAVEFNYQGYNFNSEIVWDFNDGTSSENLMPTHVYDQAGDYSVLISINNDCGSDEQYLEVHVPYLLHQNSIIGVPIKRIEGLGSSHGALELTEESATYIRDNFTKQIIEYKTNYGPFYVHIRDTANVTLADYELRVLEESQEEFSWQITQLNSGETYTFENSEGTNEAFVFDDWGFDLQINQMDAIGENKKPNGYNTASISNNNWLTYVKDEDFFLSDEDTTYPHPANWIRAGKDLSFGGACGGSNNIDMGGPSDDWADPDAVYEGVVNGMWAPYRLVGSDIPGIPFAHTPSFGYSSPFNYLNSVDIVYTDDKSLWTRVPVIETGDSSTRLVLKTAPSVNKDGVEETDGSIGFSWFPGYAIDVDKGIRLNMMFGEASDLPEHNGNDMVWNPSSTQYYGPPLSDETSVIFGGRHYLYVAYSRYAGDQELNHPLYNRLMDMSSNVNKTKVFRDIAWVSIPMLAQGQDLLAQEVKIKIRLFKPFESFYPVDPGLDEITYQNNGLPLYLFSIDGDYSDLNLTEVQNFKKKKPVRIVNFLGQEVLFNSINNGMPYIEIYEDGSASKKIKREE